ncbi:MAG: DUF488 family protein [Actinomycetota bacterium]
MHSTTRYHDRPRSTHDWYTCPRPTERTWPWRWPDASGAGTRTLGAVGSSDALHGRLRAAANHDVALLCYERDASGCHRELVADAVVQLDPSVDPHHLP